MIQRGILYDKLRFEFKHFEQHRVMVHGLKFAREWLQHRKWLEINHVDCSSFEEVAIFNDIVLKLNLTTKVNY